MTVPSGHNIRRRGCPVLSLRSERTRWTGSMGSLPKAPRDSVWKCASCGHFTNGATFRTSARASVQFLENGDFIANSVSSLA